jgi:S-adenosylmethionine-dependent methyltransferase
VPRCIGSGWRSARYVIPAGYCRPVQTVSTHYAASGRQRLVWQLLSDALPAVPEPSVLDCGGGSGSFAVPLAESGAVVTVVDISPDALATLRRRAAEVGVADRIRPVQGDVELLGDVLGDSKFDIVLAHGILQAVDDGVAALRAVAAAVRPGGLVSLLVDNPDASVITRALSGDVTAALAELRARIAADSSPTALLGIDAVVDRSRQLGLQVEAVHGIGVFTELVPVAGLEARSEQADALAELEALASTRSPYRDLASRVHVMLRRPVGAAEPHG